MKKLLLLTTFMFAILANANMNPIKSESINSPFALAEGPSDISGGPVTVEQGTTVTVNVTYEAADARDIWVVFQTLSGDTYGSKKVDVVATSVPTVIQVNIDINSATPAGVDAYRYLVYMTPDGVGWNTTTNIGSEPIQAPITVIESITPVDAIYSINGPDQVVPNDSQTVTVTVVYQAIGNNRLHLALQNTATPNYENYGTTKWVDITDTNGQQASIDIPITVNGSTPFAINQFRWSVYMSPTGAYLQSLPQDEEYEISVVENLIETFTSFASPFSNNMVLQQNSSVKIWGKNQPETEVTIATSWDVDALYSANTDVNGNWSLFINTPVGSYTPQTISATGSSTVTLSNVLIGEVWLCSGQSNMDMNANYGEFSAERDAFIAAATTDDNIRYLSMGLIAELTPQDSFNATWKPITASNAAGVSIVAYYFAKRLREQLNVPVGLIENAYGDSKIKSWIDAETLSAFDYITLPTEVPAKPRHEPTFIYNGAINPIVGYRIKGVIWYQGESDRWTPIDQYEEMHYALINSWRQKWGYDFSFYPVQIAPFSDGNSIDGKLWDMWRRAYYQISNTGVVSTIDKKSCNVIHPPEKEYVGNRLAYWALNKDYGFSNIVPSGPLAKGVEVIGNTLKVHFDFAESGLVDQGINGSNSGFKIAGSNGVFYKADVQINMEDNTLTLSNASVTDPVIGHYGFYSNCDNHQATLFNEAGLPAPAFYLDATKDFTLSIDDKSINKIHVYPIPTDSKLYIEGIGIDKNLPAKIYNTLGVLVKTTNYDASIDVSDLAKGLYILKQGKISVKFIKK